MTLDDTIFGVSLQLVCTHTLALTQRQMGRCAHDTCSKVMETHTYTCKHEGMHTVTHTITKYKCFPKNT